MNYSTQQITTCPFCENKLLKRYYDGGSIEKYCECKIIGNFYSFFVLDDENAIYINIPSTNYLLCLFLSKNQMAIANVSDDLQHMDERDDKVVMWKNIPIFFKIENLLSSCIKIFEEKYRKLLLLLK